jgi:hypothetical protein
MAGWTRQFTPFDMLKDIKAMTASMASTLFFSNDESLYLAPLLDQVLAALAACPSPLTGSTYRTLLSLSLSYSLGSVEQVLTVQLACSARLVRQRPADDMVRERD